MLARTRPVAVLVACAAVLLMAAPTSAGTQEIVMTAPYAAARSGTTCGEIGWCNNAAGGNEIDGDMAVKLEVAGAHAEVGQGEYPLSTAWAEVTATHQVPDLREQRQEVESIHYHVEMTRDQVILAGFVGRIEFSGHAVHSAGIELDGADKEALFYGGGLVLDPDDESILLSLDVRGVDGAAIPAGQIDLTVGLDAILGGSHSVHCTEAGCATVGGAAGILDTSATIDRIVATMTTRPTG